LNNNQILETALKQSALEANCRPDDFLSKENKVVFSASNPKARIYLTLPFYFNLISYGNNIVASVNGEIAETVKEYIDRYHVEHCFETPNMYVLNDELEKKGKRVSNMAEYFLPDTTMLKELGCTCKISVLSPQDFAGLYKPEWSNALEEKRKEHDVLAVGAYDGNRLTGLAGCSADCETMWQIGIDVLPSYRRQGIASALTSRLALEIIDRGKVPFYCTAWSNLGSVRNAIKSGFRPAWVEMTAKPIEEVDKANSRYTGQPSTT
jgi:GNAT superfamily N-acetyltransferase